MAFKFLLQKDLWSWKGGHERSFLYHGDPKMNRNKKHGMAFYVRFHTLKTQSTKRIFPYCPALCSQAKQALNFFLFLAGPAPAWASLAALFLIRASEKHLKSGLPPSTALAVTLANDSFPGHPGTWCRHLTQVLGSLSSTRRSLMPSATGCFPIDTQPRAPRIFICFIYIQRRPSALELSFTTVAPAGSLTSLPAQHGAGLDEHHTHFLPVSPLLWPVHSKLSFF